MTRLFIFGTLALAVAAGQENSDCRVTGFVISTKAETEAQPAENQFRMRVVDSPWEWSVGSSMPVTSTIAPGLKPGDPVEVTCDPIRYTAAAASGAPPASSTPHRRPPRG